MSLFKSLFGPKPLPKDTIPGLTLYHFTTCPFCLKVRANLRRLGLSVEHRNIHRSRKAFNELVQGGGKKQVPCLRIENESDEAATWLYESDAINRYLQEHFA